MKHDFKITFLLVSLFIVAQYTGLFITAQYIDVGDEVINPETGEVSSYNISYSELPYGMESPNVSPYMLLVVIMVGILIGTGIVLLLAKFKQRKLWRLWYFISVFYIMSLSLAKFIGEIPARITAFILALAKVFRSNIIIHNVTEIFLYSGLAIIFLQILNVPVAFLLLLIISIYDAIAVWKSKHMISLAEFQSKSNVFAGLFVPYKTDTKDDSATIMMHLPREKQTDLKTTKQELSKKKTHATHSSSKQIKQITEKRTTDSKKVTSKDRYEINRAILGGGDIAFPLVFTSVVMKSLVQQIGQIGFFIAGIIPPFVALSLFLLLYYSKKGKYYPAMPFISAGCVVGYIALRIVQFAFF